MNRQVKTLKYDVGTHFAFGRNWAEYARSIDAQTIDSATAELRRLAGPVEGRSFLDIGCGSGLHSLAALRLGVARLVAVDFDPQSVVTAKRVIGEHWRQENFECRSGNVFVDLDPVAGRFDVVYSWGVLHHTGAMWEAISRAAAMVAQDGRLVLAIYRRTPLCGLWRVEKKLYSRLPRFLQAPLDAAYALACTLGYLLSGRNPVREIRAYRSRRGMSWWHDIRDWMGGFPYESASPAEVEAFVARLGFRLTRSFKERPDRWIVRSGLLGSGCAEYVFERKCGSCT